MYTINIAFCDVHTYVEDVITYERDEFADAVILAEELRESYRLFFSGNKKLEPRYRELWENKTLESVSVISPSEEMVYFWKSEKFHQF